MAEAEYFPKCEIILDKKGENLVIDIVVKRIYIPEGEDLRLLDEEGAEEVAAFRYRYAAAADNITIADEILACVEAYAMADSRIINEAAIKDKVDNLVLLIKDRVIKV